MVLEEEIGFSSRGGALRVKRVRESHIWVIAGEKCEALLSSFDKPHEQRLIC